MSALPALLLFLALHGVFFHDVLFEGRSLSAATLVAGLTPTGPVDAPETAAPPHLLDVEGAAWVDEPSPYLARAAFAAGELPLWSPGSGLGAPLAANLNSGAGNPLQLPLNLWPSPWHADLFHLGRLLLLACGTWLFLRELGLTSLAAFVGAAIAAYGGYPMAWIVHHPLSTEIFLPFMLLGFERGRRGRASGWVLVVAAAAGSLLGGKLQASLLCFAFFGVYAAMRASPREGGRKSRDHRLRARGPRRRLHDRGVSPRARCRAHDAGLGIDARRPSAARELHGAVAVAREPRRTGALRRARPRVRGRSA